MSRTSPRNEKSIIKACQNMIACEARKQPFTYSDLKNDIFMHIEELIRVGNTFADDLEGLFQAESGHKAAKKNAKKAAAIGLLYISMGPLAVASAVVVSTIESLLRVACQSAAEAMLISYDYGRDVHGNKDDVIFRDSKRGDIQGHFFEKMIHEMNAIRVSHIQQLADDSVILDTLRGDAAIACDKDARKVDEAEEKGGGVSEAAADPLNETYNALKAHTKGILIERIHQAEDEILAKVKSRIKTGPRLDKSEMTLLKARIISRTFKLKPEQSVIVRTGADEITEMAINPAAFEPGWLRGGTHRFTGQFLKRELVSYSKRRHDDIHKLDSLIQEMPKGTHHDYRSSYNLYASRFEYKRKNMLLALVTVGELMQSRSVSCLSESDCTDIVNKLLKIAVSTPEFNKHKVNPIIWLLRNTELGDSLIEKIHPKNFNRMLTHALHLTHAIQSRDLMRKSHKKDAIPGMFFDGVQRLAAATATPLDLPLASTPRPITR